MNLSKKAKSNLVFYGIAALLILFLFFTPWGQSVRSWMLSFTLRTPHVEDSIGNETVIYEDWVLLDDKGNAIHLNEIEGPIFLNIWATWCGPCRSEMPSILRIMEKYENDITFVLVSPTEKLETLQNFKKQTGENATFYVSVSVVPDVLHSSVFPTTFIIDKDKKIRYTFSGAYDWDTEPVYELLESL